MIDLIAGMMLAGGIYCFVDMYRDWRNRGK